MNSISPRQQMVKQQVRVWDVFDQAVLNVLGDVAREQFRSGRLRGRGLCRYGNPAGAWTGHAAPDY